MGGGGLKMVDIDYYIEIIMDQTNCKWQEGKMDTTIRTPNKS